ncbi:MAG: hypothetical protein ABI895_14575 [Deltaproteobacteria bacterium]
MHAHTPRLIPSRTRLGSFGLLLLALACSDETRFIDSSMEAEQPSGSDPNSGANDSAGNASSGNQSSGNTSSGNASSGNASSGNANGNQQEGNDPSLGLSGSGGVTEPPPAAAGSEVDVSGEINEDTTWTADKTYLLQGTSPVFVVGNHTLTIEPGTLVKGAGVGTALVVTRGSRLVANGTKEEPIVFTSGVSAGLRNAGDWGGVVLLGSARLNEPAGAIEGIASTDSRGAYGGPAANEGDDTSDCGSLKYVRIEFAGYQYSVDNELNGLTLGGCGSRTVIDYVQIHRGFDDGIELFGGTVDIKHALITNQTDDGLDWDRGWTGRGQFIIVRTDPGVSDAAIEADNRDKNNGAIPRSNPTLFNLTLVGDKGTSASPGLVLRRGTFGAIHNAIVMGFPVAAIDIRDAESVDGATGDLLSVTNSIFFSNGAEGTAHADTKSDGTTAATATTPATPLADALDEGPWLLERQNQLSVDPLLADAYVQDGPKFLPPANSPAAAGGLAPPANDFFEATTYIGALPPGGADWTEGWTAYPLR